jgi:hypothetical protein
MFIMRTTAGTCPKETFVAETGPIQKLEMESTNSPQQDEDVRRSWQAGSVLEVFSASLERWYPALVMHVIKSENPPAVGMDGLKVQFWLDIDDAKSKTLCRADPHLAPFGKACKGQLPPGFQLRSSKSRPGQTVILDATTGLKYETPELAWSAHFQRWLIFRAEGTQTIRSVAGIAQAAAHAVEHVPAIAPFALQAELPMASKMDTTAAHGLVTEYELSREAPCSAPGLPKAPSNVLAYSRPEQGSAPVGLVTEYESDWITVPRDSFPQELSLQGARNAAALKDLVMTVPNHGASVPAARVPNHTAPILTTSCGAKIEAPTISLQAAPMTEPLHSDLCSPGQMAKRQYLSATVPYPSQGPGQGSFAVQPGS